jgi:hypothetical protein
MSDCLTEPNFGLAQGIHHKSLPSICVCMFICKGIARKRLSKPFTAAADTDSIITELSDAAFSAGSVSCQMKVGRH